MVRNVLVSSMAMLALGAAFAAFPASSGAHEARDSLLWARSESGRHGPFPTARRANEVANYYRSRGYDAQVYSAWGDYYVNVR